MKKIISSILISFIMSFSNAQNIGWEWAIQGGGNSWDHGYAVACDNDNNVLIRGKFVDTGYFGDTSLQAIDPEEDYLAKYTEDGILIWVRKLGGKASWEKDRSIAVDENNNIYLTGYYQTSCLFDQIKLESYGGYDGYIAKLNPFGEYVWVNTIGGAANDAGYAIAYSKNKVLVTGAFIDTAYFTTGDIISRGSTDIYVASYDLNGNEEWVVAGGSVNDDRGYGIAADEQFVYITGRISGNSVFDGINLNIIGPNDLMLAKYDLDGKISWAVNDGSSGEIESKTIAVANGDLFLTGKFSGSITFGSMSLTAKGQWDAYLVKYNENGYVEWADMFSGAYANEGNSIAVKNSRLYSTGVFGANLSIGDTTLSCNSSRDSYVCCYTVDGDFVWASDFGVKPGSNHGLGNTIAVDSKGAIYVGGEYSGGASFGGSNLTPIASFDMFLFKIQDLLIPASINHITQKPRLDIYPNPNNGIFAIQTDDGNKIDISIFDVQGKQILKKEVASGEQINISSFSEGLYYVKNNTNQGLLNKVLYIQK